MTLCIPQTLCFACSFLLSGSHTDSVGDAQVPALHDAPAAGEDNIMESVLLAEWEDRAEQGLFRYDVTACPTQLVPGAYGFIAQCNEGRASKKRATEFRVDQVTSIQFLSLLFAVVSRLSSFDFAVLLLVCQAKVHWMLCATAVNLSQASI